MRLVTSLAVIACASGLAAQDSFLVGPRALGMGGANVASVDDGTAQYYNPAAFGFFGRKPAEGVRADNNDLARRSWGFGVDVNAGGRLINDFGRYIGTLADTAQTLDNLGANGLVDQQDINDLVAIANAAANIDAKGSAFIVDANAGGTLRIGRFGLGARVFGQVSGVARLDSANLGLDDLGSGLTFAQTVNATGAASDGQIALLGGLTGVGSFDQAAIERLDFSARQSGVRADEAAALTALLVGVDAQFGANTIGNNQTSAIVNGFTVAEIPLTYGHAFSDHLSIGGSLKFMVGRVYATEVLVFENDIGEQVDAVKDNYEESANVGIDLGIMARLPYLNLGLTARNLNSPTFKGPRVNGVQFDDVTIDPQVTIGAAFLPTRTLVLEVDLDLLPSDTTLNDYQGQNVSVGVEWNAWRFLALRVGAYKNLAQGDIGPVITAGIGLNLWAVRIDLAGAMSLKTEEYDGNDYPSEARAGLRIATEW